MENLDIRKVQYIKLGKAGGSEEKCLNEGCMSIDYLSVPHKIALRGDKNEISGLYTQEGKSKSAATGFANNIIDFYQDDEHTLWFTFSNGFLYWCTAYPEVFIGGDQSKVRRCVNGWNRCSLNGKPLRISELSGALTKTAGYRGTICMVDKDVAEYLLRGIRDEKSPLITELKEVNSSLKKLTAEAIKLLQPNDFELLVDLIFSQNHWQRIGYVGSTQKTVDMEIVQPFMDYRAFIQVKSTTTQKELDAYVGDFKKRDDDFMFYAYHSSKQLLTCDEKGVRLIGCDKLAKFTIESNLLDWLMNKVG
jgi:hypothetical protein